MSLVDKETWHDDELLRDLADEEDQEGIDDFTDWLDRRNEKEMDLVEKW